MGIESAFLRELPGSVFIALGVVSQVYLGRRARLPNIVNLILAVLMPLLYVIAHKEEFPSMPHFLPSGFVVIWCWALTFIAAVVWIRRRVPDARFRPDRRALLTASATALCAAPAAALTAGVIIRKDFEIKEVDLKFPDLPKDLQGLRLLQLSDIHMGEFFSAHDLARAVDASNELRADIAFVTGDLISTKFDPLDRCLLELKRLRATSGIWGCLGNHEMHAKLEDYAARKALEFDIRFLRHEAFQLAFGKSKINLVGVDHQRRSVPYLEHVEDLVARDQFNLLLSHNPDVFPVAARKGFQLTLAGHTHGGQINIALAGANLNLADLVTPYTKGFYKLPDSSLYVNSGLGTIGVPVRLGAPPEVTLIRLCNT